MLVTPEKLSKIVNNCFDVSLSWEWAKILLKLKNESKLTFESTPDGLNFEESWQTKFGAQILLEFKNWFRQTIALHRTVPLPGKNPASQGGSRPSSNPVKNASSVFKCPLCSGNHSDKRGRPRKYLAACNSFLEQTVPQRWNTIRRLKMCQVCTSAAEHGKFGENCHLKRLACKCSSDKLHHTLLCSKDAAHAVASSSNPPDNSDKGAKPKKDNKSKKKTSKANSQSTLPQVS